MLIYDPAFDSFHSALRQYALLREAKSPIEVEAAQIMDFYLLYPEVFVDFRVSPKFKRWKSYSKRQKTPYRNASGSKTSFLSFCTVFNVATSLLVAKGFLNDESVERGSLVLSDNGNALVLEVPRENMLSRGDGFLEALVEMYFAFGLYGKNGLKARSGLLEYKNDVV
ncbi:ABC-three component system middle component 5 [Halomonas elongata]|uniref:ABC-three component system middle component 5 n=1 Tax=Halomonas elongata TaxID=2746 RepID=UPI00186B6FEE|nr:ABC-three component system middle component 5 [Halomonas elongata]MBW5798618.1 hypothetical protein [Halomonas elongata]